jgi:hypothetical protein
LTPSAADPAWNANVGKWGVAFVLAVLAAALLLLYSAGENESPRA